MSRYVLCTTFYSTHNWNVISIHVHLTNLFCWWNSLFICLFIFQATRFQTHSKYLTCLGLYGSDRKTYDLAGCDTRLLRYVCKPQLHLHWISSLSSLLTKLRGGEIETSLPHAPLIILSYPTENIFKIQLGNLKFCHLVCTAETWKA